jgi:hypothetical protein
MEMGLLSKIMARKVWYIKASMAAGMAHHHKLRQTMCYSGLTHSATAALHDVLCSICGTCHAKHADGKPHQTKGNVNYN